MKQYTTQVPIEHDGNTYAIGAPIELADKAAVPLLAVGAIAAKGHAHDATGGDAQAKVADEVKAAPAKAVKVKAPRSKSKH